jgi:hypothetical protein
MSANSRPTKSGGHGQGLAECNLPVAEMRPLAKARWTSLVCLASACAHCAPGDLQSQLTESTWIKESAPKSPLLNVGLEFIFRQVIRAICRRKHSIPNSRRMMTLRLPPSPNWSQLESTLAQQPLGPSLKNNQKISKRRSDEIVDKS